MTPELKAKWTAALRSGQYRQGKRVLHRRVTGLDSFCCLGVLCEITEVSKVEKNTITIQSYKFPPDSDEELKYGLNEPLMLHTGITQEQHDYLCILNDGSPAVGYADAKSFPEIAQWIEENL